MRPFLWIIFGAVDEDCVPAVVDDDRLAMRLGFLLLGLAVLALLIAEVM